MKRRDFVQTLVALTALPRQGTWKTWRVNGPRVNQHLTDLSQFGRNPQGGVSRVAFSDADIAGRRFMMDLMPSGAGHDAQDLARIGPMGMIFVPSVKGISHSPLELTRPDDVTNGANVLLQTVLRLDQA